MGTDAELAAEPAGANPTRRYEITFTDGSVHTVTPDADHDVGVDRDGGVTLYAPGRRTSFPPHRVRAVTLYGWDQEG